MQMQSNQPKKPCIVVVNDDFIQLGTLKGILERGGYAVNAHSSAEQALQAMHEQKPPDLIITDLYMPDIDGWRFCRLLRSPEYRVLNEIPILLMSATFSGEEAERITRATGADAFLSMPVEAGRLKKAVQDILLGRFRKASPRILIVEDSKSLARLLKQSFESHYYQADTAMTACEARDMFQSGAYDAAVIDHHLPDGQGLNLVEEFTVNRPQCVCIIMTSDPKPGLALEYMKKGAADYVRKPFAPEFLVKVCARARRERALLRVEILLEQRTIKLRKSENRYRRLINNIPDIIYIFSDLRGGVFWSPGVESVLGYSPEYMQENPFLWNESIHPHDREKVTTTIIESSHGRQFEIEYRIQDAQGNWRWLHDRSTARLNRDGETFIEGIATDITARKQAEEELHKRRRDLERIFSSAKTVSLIKTDLQGIIEEFSAGAEDIFGYARDEMIGLNVGLLHTEEEAGRLSDYVDELLKGRGFTLETSLVRKSGQEFPALFSVQPVFDAQGQVVSTLGISFDITERKRAEEEIKDINVQLQKANAEKDLLFSIIAHDLKSPMSGLMASTEMLASQRDTLSHEETLFLSGEMHKNVKNTFMLLEELLQWAQMSQGGIDYAPEPCSLNELIHKGLATVQDMAGVKNISVYQDIPGDLTVLADKPMIKTVIRNVICNAVKFTPQGGNISVTAGNTGSDVEVCVMDDGIGMNDSILSTIFSVDKGKRQLGTNGEKGTGLGLMLCKEFVEKHGGRIWLESETDKGTKVFFTLPGS